MKKYIVIIILLCLVRLYQIGAAPEAQTVQAANVQPAQQFTAQSEREQWALALLAAVGNAQPSQPIVGAVVEWTIAEDGSDGALNRNNPWNTTMCGFNMIGSINADGACGVGHYATMEDGVAANAATLAQTNFSEIRAALQTNDAEGFKSALWASPWAASRYNYGAAWPVYEVQQSVAIGGKHGVTNSMEVAAAFDTVNCDFWGNQPNCQHFGNDMPSGDNDPVYAPFDGTWVETNEYLPGDPSCPRCLGQYVRYVTLDGYEMYLGHIKDAIVLQPGAAIQSGTVVGRIRGDLGHTHWQCRAPDGSLEDCIGYYNSH